MLQWKGVDLGTVGIKYLGSSIQGKNPISYALQVMSKSCVDNGVNMWMCGHLNAVTSLAPIPTEAT